MIDIVVTCLQVIFDTAASLKGTPLPVQMHMHGSEGVTPALHFDITQGGGLTVHDCTAQAVGELHQLTVWVDPAMVRTNSYCFWLPPCWIVLLSTDDAVLNQHSSAITFQNEALVCYLIRLPGLQLRQAIKSRNSSTKALVQSFWSHQHAVLHIMFYLRRLAIAMSTGSNLS